MIFYLLFVERLHSCSIHTILLYWINSKASMAALRKSRYTEQWPHRKYRGGRWGLTHLVNDLINDDGA